MADMISYDLILDPDVMARLDKVTQSAKDVHFTLDHFVQACIDAASVNNGQFSDNLNTIIQFARNFSSMRSEDKPGYPGKIHYPGKHLVSGKVKVDAKILVPFFPDEPPLEANTMGSPLDDLIDSR